MPNFDFGGYIDDDNKFEEMPLSKAEENVLSPYGVLCAKLGRVRARTLFSTLEDIARRISDEKGGTPAIVFNKRGGQFVTILEADDEIDQG